MNMRVTLLSLALSLALVAAASGQTDTNPAQTQPRTPSDAPWQVIFFTPGDSTATAFVDDAIRAGSIPVGLEVTPGESLGILFARTNLVTVESWAILEYDDWNAIEAEITGGITDGFVPMDISRYDETLAILWIKADLVIEGWRLSTSANTIADRTRTVNDFQSQGLTLWGLSVHEDLVWYLFLRQPGVPPAGAISAFGKEGRLLQSGLVEASAEGWVPNGLASSDRSFYICFAR
jgi:hypothetical protein